MTSGKNDYSFTMVDDATETRLVVIGVGGMGNNAMENLARVGVTGLELYSLNTDVQALRRCRGSKPVQLGAKRTGGKGAGGNSEIGRMAAEDDSEKIRKIVAGAELVFIVSGMGGGTGSGAAPVVAKICRESGVVSVCIVTMPMGCEGTRRGEKGINGLAELRKCVDSLLIIENEKLSEVMDKEDVSIIDVFRKADKVVVDVVTAIARIVNSHGYINLDLADLKNVLQRDGKDGSVEAYIGYGEASGADRARKASEIALNNPLLRTINIQGAANLLVNVAGSEQIGHKEAMSAVKNVVDCVGSENREIFMGVVTDNSLGDSICVTVIATGLPPGANPVVRIKPGDTSQNRVFPGQRRSEVATDNIYTNHNGVDDNRSVASDPEVGASVNFLPDVTGISPLVRKDEWQIPAYIRAKVKSDDIEDRLPGPRFSQINVRSKNTDQQPDQVAAKSQFRQPLYHMAG